MTITYHNGFAILPKRCDCCRRVFWLEWYDVFYRRVGIEQFNLKQTKCKRCSEEMQR